MTTIPNNLSLFDLARAAMAQACQLAEGKAERFTAARKAAFAFDEPTPKTKARVVRVTKLSIVGAAIEAHLEQVKEMLPHRSMEYIAAWVAKRSGQEINPWLARKYLTQIGLYTRKVHTLSIAALIEQNRERIEALRAEGKKLTEVAAAIGVNYHSFMNYRANHWQGAV
jgi:hypothetical protein